MPAPRRQPRRQHVAGRVEMDEDDARFAGGEAIAVRLLERGTGDDDRCLSRQRVGDPGADGIEPRSAVRVGQWFAARHLCNVGWGVQIVGVEERPGEPQRERLADGRLSGAGHAHHDDGQWAHAGERTRRAGRATTIPVARLAGRY